MAKKNILCRRCCLRRKGYLRFSQPWLTSHINSKRRKIWRKLWPIFMLGERINSVTFFNVRISLSFRFSPGIEKRTRPIARGYFVCGGSIGARPVSCSFSSSLYFIFYTYLKGSTSWIPTNFRQPFFLNRIFPNPFSPNIIFSNFFA